MDKRVYANGDGDGFSTTDNTDSTDGYG